MICARLQPRSSGHGCRNKCDILNMLNLEDTSEHTAPSRLRDREAESLHQSFLSGGNSPCVYSGPRARPYIVLIQKLAHPFHVRSSSCPHGTETNPDFTGNANRRLLAASALRNCWSVPQKRLTQRKIQATGSQGRCRHEYSTAIVGDLCADSRHSQKEKSAVDRYFAREARFAR